MKGRRFISYLIDLIMILVLTAVLQNSIVKDTKIYRHTVDVANETFVKGRMSLANYIEEVSSAQQEIAKKELLLNASNLLFIGVLAIIVPYFNHNQTIGQRLMKLKTVSSHKKVTIKELLIRSIVLYGCLELTTMILLSYLIPSKPYFIITTILSFIQFILVIISGFMVLYRRDEKGLHDIISNTCIENI